ncbi:MAG: carboxymuconolactone decarboxylase family protein [Longimicrobiales bacterium]|nr:carboxymuconolactone decarboxylase family protein [Longimicrobiales bacterium]
MAPPRRGRDLPLMPTSTIRSGDASRWGPDLAALVRLSGALSGGEGVDLEPHLRRAARDADATEVEEAILQSYLFLGYPTALNAFAIWRDVSGRDAPPEVGADEDRWMWRARGETVCRSVYGEAYEALRENIGRLKPEMGRSMIEEGYGRVLGRPGLSIERRECCITAILAVQHVPVQLRSHLRGALRCGVTVEVVERILEVTAPFGSAAAAESARNTWSLVCAGEDS